MNSCFETGQEKQTMFRVEICSTWVIASLGVHIFPVAEKNKNNSHKWEIYIYIYTHTHKHTHIYMCRCKCEYIYIYVLCVGVYTHIHTRMCAQLHVCIHICVFIYTCVCIYVRVCSVTSVMSKSLQLYGLQPFRHLCLWDFSSMNTGVGSNFLVQGIFPTQGSSWHRALLCLLHYRWIFCFWVPREAVYICVCVCVCVYIMCIHHIPFIPR